MKPSANKKPKCPHCNSTWVVSNGNASNLPRFKCRDCNRTFNSLTGTPFARLQIRDATLDALTRRASSIDEAADDLGVSVSTALRWRQRYLAATPSEKRRLKAAINPAHRRG